MTGVARALVDNNSATFCEVYFYLDRPPSCPSTAPPYQYYDSTSHHTTYHLNVYDTSTTPAPHLDPDESPTSEPYQQPHLQHTNHLFLC